MAHGLWVWRTAHHLERGDAALVATCRAASVDEVYLAVDARVLVDARLPLLVTRLHDAGIRVEALMGDATWYRTEARPRMHALIDAVGAYDEKAPDAARFDGVHLDIEPHQLRENKGTRTYLPALAATLREARVRSDGLGLTTAADLPRFAIEDAPELRAAFTAAVPRIFLMLYELRDRSTERLLRAARATADLAFPGGESKGTLVIGVSVDDYDGAELGSRLAALDAGRPGGAHYGGWAIHDERRLTTH